MTNVSPGGTCDLCKVQLINGICPQCEDQRRPVICLEHVFAYKGMVYEKGRKMPSSDARDMIYFEHYFCTRCLHDEYKRIGIIGNQFGGVQFNATPKRS